MDIEVLDSFAREHKIETQKLKDIAEGKIPEYRGWRQQGNINSRNIQWRPPRPTEPSPLQKKWAAEDEAHKKALKKDIEDKKPIPATKFYQFTKEGN